MYSMYSDIQQLSFYDLLHGNEEESKSDKGNKATFYSKIELLKLNETIQYKNAIITRTERFYELQKSDVFHEIFHSWEDCYKFCIEKRI